MNETTKNTTQKDRYFCKHCNQTLIGSFSFKSHLFGHNAIKARFQCKYCSKEYYRFDNYSRHVNNHLGIHKKTKFICNYCDRLFVNKYNIMAHLKNIHDDCIDPKYVKFPCAACGVVFCEKRILTHHIRKCHFNIELKDEPSHFSKLLNEKWIEPAVNNSCVEMTKVNNNVIIIKKCAKIEDVKIKRETEKSTNLYGSQFTDQYSKAVCDYCKKEMMKKNLRIHIRERHMKNKKFKCNKCEKSFLRQRYLLEIHNCGVKKRLM